MGYINFAQRDYLGRIEYYSIPAVATDLVLGTNLLMTSEQFNSNFAEAEPISFGAFAMGFQGMTYGEVINSSENTETYALMIGNSEVTEDNIPKIIYTDSYSTPCRSYQPNYPTLTLMPLFSQGRYSVITYRQGRYPYGGGEGPLNSGMNTLAYPGIVNVSTGVTRKRVFAIFMYNPERNSYAGYVETDSFDYTSAPRYNKVPTYGTYMPDGPSAPAGGGGMFGTDRENDDITQLIPPGSAANSLTDAGIFSHYLVNSAQLKDFSRWLFSDNFLEVLNKELVELLFGSTFDAIISLMSYPFAVGQLPMITSKPSNIYLGHFNTKAGTSGLLTSDSSQLDWGNIDITEYWGNFLDYAPHTKIQLYLPWGTGFVDIDPNECMNGSLNVKTNIELTKGNCVHIVSNSRGAVIGTYNGFCGAQYPITSKDTSGKAIGAVISAVSAAVAVGTRAAGALSGQAGMTALEGSIQAKEMGFRETGFLRMEGLSRLHDQSTYNSISANAARTAVGSAVAAARTPAIFNRSGSFSPNAGHLSVQVPYIIMTWPDQSIPEQYGNYVGYPSNIFARLGSLNGYTEVGAIHLDYINCTEHEREELLRILQGGVIL